MGRRRVAGHRQTREKVGRSYALYHGDAVWNARGCLPKQVMQITPDLKLGAYRQQRQRPFREVTCCFPNGRDWTAGLRAGDAWHQLRRTVARIMRIDFVLFDFIVNGQVVNYDLPVPATITRVATRWKYTPRRERSRSRDRDEPQAPQQQNQQHAQRFLPEPEQRHRAQLVEEVDAHSFYIHGTSRWLLALSTP